MLLKLFFVGTHSIELNGDSRTSMPSFEKIFDVSEKTNAFNVSKYSSTSSSTSEPHSIVHPTTISSNYVATNSNET